MPNESRFSSSCGPSLRTAFRPNAWSSATFARSAFWISGSKASWRMGSCSTGTTTTGSFNNAAQNKFKKWDDRFSKRRIKCKGSQDIKFLKVFDICNNGASGNNCTYNNTQKYQNTGIYEKWYLGKMEVNMNDGGKRKYLYFQIH